MNADSSGAPGQRCAGSTVLVGDRVYIKRGPLSGLIGECTQILSDGRCLLKIDNWQAGVNVVVPLRSVRTATRS